LLRAVISCEMKRIDEKQFYGAGAGDEIVNSAVMTIATAASQCFQRLWVKTRITAWNQCVAACKRTDELYNSPS